MAGGRDWLYSNSDRSDLGQEEREDKGLVASQARDDAQEPEWEVDWEALGYPEEESPPSAEETKGSKPSAKELEGSDASAELSDENEDDLATQHQEYKIDPTNMSAREVILVTRFLNGQLHKYGNILTRKDTTYYFDLVHEESRWSINIVLRFIYDIAWYISEKHPEEDRFAVVGHTRIGHSDACDVWEVKGKLTPNAGRLFYHSHEVKPPTKQWVAKYERHYGESTKEDAVKSYRLAKANSKLGLRHPMWVATEKKRGMSITLMRRLKDYDLGQAIEEGTLPGHIKEVFERTSRWDLNEVFYFRSKGKISFSDIETLEYSLATAIAYKEQVSDIGVTHRDIKSENIMLDLSLGPQSSAFTFFDYGFARKITEQDSSLCGSIGYTAPEILERKGRASNKCDIYSLGCVLAQWFEDFSSYDDLPDDDLGLAQARSRQFTQLAANTPPEIKALLNRMVTYNPDERPDMDEVITIYREVIEYKKLEEFEPAPSPSQTMAMK